MKMNHSFGESQVGSVDGIKEILSGNVGRYHIIEAKVALVVSPKVDNFFMAN